MNRIRMITLAGTVLLVGIVAATEARRFEWTTESEEAKNLLSGLQARVENFEAGAALAEMAQKLVASDPEFAMGEYYLSVVLPPNEGQPHIDKAVELSKKASDGERRFIEAMVLVRGNGGANFQEAIPSFEKLADDYPDERMVFMLLGQLYQGVNESEKARSAFERALAIGPPSARARTFLANADLLKGEYQEARSAFMDVAKGLPEGSAPFAVRYGVAYSYLYEENTEKAADALEIYLDEYRESGAAQAFPEVFIWNSIARIHLEGGRPEQAMQAYEKGYESVPSSDLPDDQKELWLGRLRHGKCRTLAKMGKHEEAWAEAEEILKMIEEGGESAQQYLPAYHYLVGYLKLESGDWDVAVEHLLKSNPNDPFHKLLLARAYEKKGDQDSARQAYQEVVSSTQNGLERALAYPEAERKLRIL